MHKSIKWVTLRLGCPEPDVSDKRAVVTARLEPPLHTCPPNLAGIPRKDTEQMRSSVITLYVLWDQFHPPPLLFTSMDQVDPKPRRPKKRTSLGQSRHFGTHLSGSGQKWREIPQKVPLTRSKGPILNFNMQEY
eukprot:scaffold72609_cov17-Tisochrysis_lutea.AAC.1